MTLWRCQAKPKKAKSKPYKPKLDPNWIQDVDLDADLPEFVMLRALKMMVQLPAKVGPHDVTLIFPRKSGNTKGTLVEGKDLAFDKDNDIVLPENMPQRLIMGAEEDAAAVFGAVRQRCARVLACFVCRLCVNRVMHSIKEDSKDALKQLKQLASGERKWCALCSFSESVRCYLVLSLSVFPQCFSAACVGTVAEGR